MPTAYTAPLHDGEGISFEQFVLRCSRAMGAAIMQRDESPDVEIRLREVGDHYLEYVEKAGVALVEAWERADEEWARLQAAAIADAEKYRADYLTKREGIRDRYVDMLAAVQRWEPPTSEHVGLKDFLALRESLGLPAPALAK